MTATATTTSTTTTTTVEVKHKFLESKQLLKAVTFKRLTFVTERTKRLRIEFHLDIQSLQQLKLKKFTLVKNEIQNQRHPFETGFWTVAL